MKLGEFASETHTKALIYCRVSSSKQKKQGDGLASQETRCREFARYKGLEVVDVFQDDASGGLIDRPGIQAMLRFIRKRRKDGYVVIIDDVSRLARGLDAHLALRTAIAEAGGVLQSPSIEFGEDSDSILVENMLASVSQHQRQKNAEQTRNRMRARVLNGYCVTSVPPKGFVYKSVPGHNKLLVRDEPLASILQEALEGYACGRFQTQVEVKRFLESQPDYPKDLPDGTIRNQRIHDILTQPLYAGYIEMPSWGISLRKAQHEGLISFETFERIQARLKGTAKAPARKDISEDFPVRGAVVCSDCDKPLTSCWSKSKTGKKHPYYMCKTKGCVSYRKSIRRDQLEGDVEDFLKKMQPGKALFAVAKAMFHDLWDARLAKAEENAKAYDSKVKDAEKKIAALLDRIVETDNLSVVSAYESKIATLEREKMLLAEKASTVTKPRYTREELFELAFEFLSSPWNIYKNGSLALKRTVLRLAFVEPISYCRNEGVRTPKITFPFKVLGDVNMGRCEMAHLRGFEPLASAFGGQRSIQLSYRCVVTAGYTRALPPLQREKLPVSNFMRISRSGGR